MPLTPDEQRIMDHLTTRLALLRGLSHGSRGVTGLSMKSRIDELHMLKDILTDIQATRDGDYPCDQIRD